MKTAILAIILFCALIFPHELGHFIVAKLCNVQVNQFALGMGPAILKKQKGETLYALRAFPIGGYCAMEGENEESDNPRAFNNKKAWQKILVLFAGSFMNILICVIIMISIAASSGTPTTTIGEVTEGMPAYGIINSGDILKSVDGTEIKVWEDFGNTIQNSYKNGKKTVEIKVDRDGQIKTLNVPLKYVKDENRAVVGVLCMPDKSIGKAAVNGIKATGHMAIDMKNAIAMLFNGKAGMKDLAGPVGIVSVVSQTSTYGLLYFFYLMAFISLNLAFVNLLPLPALDGGRIIFVIIRKITGKMIDDQTEGMVHAIGLILLLALMFYVTWNDIVRLI